MKREVLNRIRQRKGVTIEQLSERTDIPVSTLSKICAGITNTSFDNMSKIAAALNCSLDLFSDYRNSEDTEG